MDAYPHQYVAHNLPLVALLGLSDEQLETGLEIHKEFHDGLQEESNIYQIELPTVSEDVSQSLLLAFRDLDARDASWNSRPGPGKMGSVGFTYRNAGRNLTLPPHKASPPLSSELEDLPSSFQVVLHSPISPLTHSSPLYPDGIFTPSWLAKHQSLLPTAIICFFPFTVDATRSSLEDNALKTEINRLRSWFGETKYTTRLVVVLVCDEPAHVSTVVERLGNIRRATNLDTKTLLYMPGGLSNDEARAFVGSLLSNIHATCIDYYRDLSKHARRKKNRGSTPTPTIPPTSGTSHVLSARGWNLRYETKLGVFAEFRGEMEAAERSYEQAYEDLMDGDILEGISDWSPRFNEARLLADALAIRILRCLLWTNQTTSAAQSWSNHKYRMRDLIEKKGKGTTTYGWQAWDANWSKVMADILEKVQLPFFFVPDPTDDAPLVHTNVYAPAEKIVSKETATSPCDHLHHQGYWQEQAAKKMRKRRNLALSIPPEDRRAPGESPASALASRAHIYDTYLCLEPHEEYLEAVKKKGIHSQFLLSSVINAESHAKKRQHLRALARLRLETVQELMSQGEWKKASEIVKSILDDSLWRREGWWQLLGEAFLQGHRCFSQIRDLPALLSAVWQLQSSILPIAESKRPNIGVFTQDHKSDQKVEIKLDNSNTVPCLLTNFTYGSNYACVGDPLDVQVTFTPCFDASILPFTLGSIHIIFKGMAGKVLIRNKLNGLTKENEMVRLQKSVLEQAVDDEDSEEKPPIFEGTADLTFDANSIQVYQFSITPRESQDLSVQSVVVNIEEEAFLIEITETISKSVNRPVWWQSSEGGLVKNHLDLSSNDTVDVKPRPPKMQITFSDLKETYYTDEVSQLGITLVNEENAPADVRLKVHVFHGDKSAEINWSDYDGGHALVSESGSMLPQRDIGKIDASASQTFAISIAKLSEMGSITLEIEAVYTLLHDPNTIITKSLSHDLSFVRPFEANFETSAGVYPEPWPSYFDVSREGGLVQRAYVTAKILAYTSESLLIEDIELKQIEPVEETVECDIKSDRPHGAEPVILNSNELRNCVFTVDSRKKNMEDRQHVDLQFCLIISWRRQPSNSAHSATPPSKTALPGSMLRLDFGKPRALASANMIMLKSATSPLFDTPIINVTYTLENPSDYMLQFDIVMEATEQFAFSGPKVSTLQLTPFSRAEIKFNLLPIQRGIWINPVVRITDIGFGEVLRVHAAEGMKAEKGRCMIWVPKDDDDDQS